MAGLGEQGLGGRPALPTLQAPGMSGLLGLTGEGNCPRGKEVASGKCACPTRTHFSENLLPKPQAGPQHQGCGCQLDEKWALTQAEPITLPQGNSELRQIFNKLDGTCLEVKHRNLGANQ